MSLALRSMRTGRGRLVGSVAGVALSIVLVLFVAAVFNGFDVAATGIVETAGADVWVGQEDALDMFHSVSRVPATIEPRIRGVGGVASVTPLFARAAPGHLFHEDGPSVELYVIGFDPTAGLGGPRDVVEGTTRIGREEVVVTRALVQNEGVGIGDRIHVLDRTFVIAGVSDTATTGAFTFAFIDGDVAREMFLFGDVVSYFLVTTTPDVDPSTVATALEERLASADVVVMTTDAFAVENSRAMSDILDPILLTITALASVVGLAVVAITTWSAVNERLTDYGILKAIGARDADLYRVVFTQAAIYAFLGFALALPLALALVAVVDRTVATVPVATDWRATALALPVVAALALVASWLPLRRLARIDPAEVLRRA